MKKSRGADENSTEYKYGGDLIQHQLILKIWKNKTVPKDSKASVIIAIYKKNGNLSATINAESLDSQQLEKFSAISWIFDSGPDNELRFFKNKSRFQTKPVE